MRFKFCGDLDCPDWVLAEIATLSKLTSIKIKLFSAQVVKGISGNEIDYEKITKLATDAKYEPADVKGSAAAVTFIISSAAKYDVDAESLSNELQQLGLPKEHSVSLCKLFEEHKASLQAHFTAQSFRLNRLESINWRIDYVLGSSQLQTVEEPQVQLCIKVRDADSNAVNTHAFTLTTEKFDVLLHEMKQAYSIVEKLQT